MRATHTPVCVYVLDTCVCVRDGYCVCVCCDGHLCVGVYVMGTRMRVCV